MNRQNGVMKRLVSGLEQIGILSARGIARLLGLAGVWLAAHTTTAATLDEQLQLQHHLDYQVPLSHATFIGTHNSYNAENWGYFIANIPGVASLSLANHQKHPIEQLDGGFRVLNFDIHSYEYGNGTFDEVLCHYPSGDSTLCSGTDKTLAEGLSALDDWLVLHPDEVVLLIIEDYVNTERHDEAVKTINTSVGDKVYRPNNGHIFDGTQCSELPVASLTKQMVLDAGKQLIIADGGEIAECSIYSKWERWVWHLNANGFKADLYKGKDSDGCRIITKPPYYDCSDNSIAPITRYFDKLGMVYEDRAAGDLLTGSEAELSGSEIRDALERGAAVIGLDKALSNDRRSDTVWSWDEDEPNNSGNEDCANQRSSGHWNDASCSRSYRFACQHKITGEWRVSDSSGPWSQGQSACSALGSDYFFSVPVNAVQNKALREATGADSNTLWLNYNDRAHEGTWVPVHYWNGPQIDRTPATKISLKTTNNKYAVAKSTGRLDASSTVNGSWEKFDLMYNDDDTYSFRSVHGTYARYLTDGGVMADSYTIGMAEKFNISPIFGSNKIAISNIYGKYWVANSSGELNGNSKSVGDWESFQLGVHAQISSLRWTLDGTGAEINNRSSAAVKHGGASYITGAINQALYFNGVDGYADIASSGAINFGRDDNFTVAAWILVDGTQNGMRVDNSIIEKWNGSEGYPYAIRYLNHRNSNVGKIWVGRYDGSKSTGMVSRARFDDGEYHHVAFVKKGKSLKLYVDGYLDSEVEDTLTGDTSNGSPLYLGRRGSATVPVWFKGEVDDLRILNYAVSAAELAETIVKR